MEETDWLSHNIFEVPDRYKDIIKTRDSHEYRQNLQDGFHIESENYKQINNIKDIEDRVWLND
jgi:hypothetical protein